MFVLDTNILSAMMRLDRMTEVAAWMAGQDEGALYTTAVSHAEIFSGLAIMADGRRRRALERAADEMFDVTSYEVNPANISEKFQNQKVMLRTKKPDGN